jgi:hypothetical protein
MTNQFTNCNLYEELQDQLVYAVLFHMRKYFTAEYVTATLLLIFGHFFIWESLFNIIAIYLRRNNLLQIFSSYFFSNF